MWFWLGYIVTPVDEDKDCPYEWVIESFNQPVCSKTPFRLGMNHQCVDWKYCIQMSVSVVACLFFVGGEQIANCISNTVSKM